MWDVTGDGLPPTSLYLATEGRTRHAPRRRPAPPPPPPSRPGLGRDRTADPDRGPEVRHRELGARRHAAPRPRRPRGRGAEGGLPRLPERHDGGPCRPRSSGRPSASLYPLWKV